MLDRAELIRKTDRVTVYFHRKVQIVQYEPVEFGASFETDVQPGETPAMAHARAHAAMAESFNSVQADVFRSFGVKTDHRLDGGTPPPPPPQKKV